MLGQARVSDERLCYNCRGLGHTKVDANGKVICPSPVKPRSLSHCIAALEQARKQEAARTGKRRFIARKPTKVSGRMTNTSGEQVELIEIDDNNNVYSADGENIGMLHEIADQTDDERDAPAQPPTAKAGLACASELTDAHA